MHEAMFYENIGNKDIVKCSLCPQYCYIQEGMFGACAIRRNVKGKLYTLVYGKAIAHHVDPIEKKPLFHFMPGSRIYSYATAGCNFRCSFCQNWDISQISKGEEGKIIGVNKSPEKIAEEAIMQGCNSVAMTYNEPSIQLEYALDCCKEAKKKGLFSVFVSNGYITDKAIDVISPYLDAINIDLKGFTDEYYKKVCGARLKPVLDSIKHYYKKGVWVEITTLVIPGENDSDKELRQIASFVASVNVNMPWHISRFHPDYKMMDKDATPVRTLYKAYNIGKKAGLKYVYVGNVFCDELENTYCPNCERLLIRRHGFTILEYNMAGNECKYCNEIIPGKFS